MDWAQPILAFSICNGRPCWPNYVQNVSQCLPAIRGRAWPAGPRPLLSLVPEGLGPVSVAERLSIAYTWLFAASCISLKKLECSCSASGHCDSWRSRSACDHRDETSANYAWEAMTVALARPCQNHARIWAFLPASAMLDLQLAGSLCSFNCPPAGLQIVHMAERPTMGLFMKGMSA